MLINGSRQRVGIPAMVVGRRKRNLFWQVYEVDEIRILIHRLPMATIARSQKAFPMKISELPKKQQAFARTFRPALAKAAENHDPLDVVRMVMAVVGEQLPANRKPQTSLARAMARGNVAREEMKSSEGGSLSAEEAGAKLGISKAATLKRFQKGQLLGWREAKQNAVRFPVWQMEDNDVIPGLPKVLAVLDGTGEIDDWAKIVFFLTPLASMDGKRPLDLLRSGNLQKVVWAAQGIVG